MGQASGRHAISLEDVARITAYLSLHETPIGRADLAFVFGTRFPDPTMIALDLLRRDVVPPVVLTGGANRQTEQGHAAVLKEWHAIPRYLAMGHIAELRRAGDAYR
jgi:hypothetical protein